MAIKFSIPIPRKIRLETIEAVRELLKKVDMSTQ